jgi:hypothetical protein
MSVTLAVVPDIAIGDVSGNCVISPTILVVLNFMLREAAVYCPCCGWNSNIWNKSPIAGEFTGT